MTEEQTQTQKATSKTFSGVVVSDKMKDTVVVLVNRYVKHPKYKKYIRRSKRYQAHDAGNAHTVGDKVMIRETRPISKSKRFVVVNN